MKRLMILLSLFFVSCKAPEQPPKPAGPSGNAARGKVVIEQFGCTACHAIPGVEGPRGMVGPALENVAARPVIAGSVQNTPENMAKWILNPQAFDAANTMPALGLTEEQARDAVAYLWTR